MLTLNDLNPTAQDILILANAFANATIKDATAKEAFRRARKVETAEACVAAHGARQDAWEALKAAVEAATK